jgi:hypothetical protein
MAPVRSYVKFVSRALANSYWAVELVFLALVAAAGAERNWSLREVERRTGIHNGAHSPGFGACEKDGGVPGPDHPAGRTGPS